MKLCCPAIFFLLLSLTSNSQDFRLAPDLEQRLREISLDDSLLVDLVINEALDQTPDKEEQAKVLLAAGIHLVNTYKYELADLILSRCLDLATENRVLAEANYQAGLSLMFRDIRLRSLKYLHEALGHFTTLGDSLGMGKTLDKIADNHNYIGEHETARPFYDRCIEIFTGIRDTARLTNVLGNIGGMMSEENEHDSALFYYRKAVALNEKAGNLSNLSSDLSGMAIALEGLGRIDEAYSYYHKAFDIAGDGGLEEDIAFANQHLGYFHFNRGNYDSAIYYMEITHDHAQRMNYGQLLINSLDVLHRSANQQQDHKRAYEILSAYHELEDSLLNLENVSLINSLRSEYELERRESENAALLEQAKLREQVIDRQSKLNTSLLVGALILLLALAGLIWLNALRRKKNRIIQKDRDLIRKQADRLQELDDFKSSFFANISHDLRTPLGLIHGFANLIRTGEKELGQESKDYLGFIEDNVDRLKKMTDEINQLIQLEENRYQFSYEEIEIKKFFDTLSKMFLSSEAKNMLEFRLHQNVDDSKSIRADRAALEKVIFNVVGNAFKYNTTGSKVDLKVSANDTHLHVKVVDDGPGIQQDHLEKVFDRYYRTERGANAAKGQGIGLSLARELVELHGGIMSVSSIPNKETCFEFSLPLNSSEAG